MPILLRRFVSGFSEPTLPSPTLRVRTLVVTAGMERRSRHDAIHSLWSLRRTAGNGVSPRCATSRRHRDSCVLYGSDAAVGGNLRPREGWAAFRRLPLTDGEFERIARNVAPYLR